MTMKKIWWSIKTILLTLFVISILTIYSNFALADDFDCFTKSGSRNCTIALVDSEECLLKYDYTINFDDTGGDGVVLSIHGGSIEPYTSELADKVAEKLKWKRYDFFGHGTTICIDECSTDSADIRKSNFKRLHITSSKFNEPKALELVTNNTRTVSIHGYS